MLNIIMLTIGNLSLTFTAVSSPNTLQSVILPFIDFVFIFYLLVRAVFLINSLGVNQQLDDFMDASNSTTEDVKSDEDMRKQLYRHLYVPQHQTKTVTFIECALMVYAFISYIALISRAVTS